MSKYLSFKYLQCLDSSFVLRFVNKTFIVGRILLLIHIPFYYSLPCGNANEPLESEVLLQFTAGIPLLDGHLNTKQFYVVYFASN